MTSRMSAPSELRTTASSVSAPRGADTSCAPQGGTQANRRRARPVAPISSLLTLRLLILIPRPLPVPIVVTLLWCLFICRSPTIKKGKRQLDLISILSHSERYLQRRHLHEVVGAKGLALADAHDLASLEGV